MTGFYSCHKTDKNRDQRLLSQQMFSKTIIELEYMHTSNQDLLVPVIDSVQSYRLSSATEVSKSFDLLNCCNATLEFPRKGYSYVHTAMSYWQ